jgi:hypothetical protein
MGWPAFWAIFFTNSSGHPGLLSPKAVHKVDQFLILWRSVGDIFFHGSTNPFYHFKKLATTIL